MIKKMTCIQCPKGCQLEVNYDGSRVISITGNQCEKGPIHARQEIESPTRTLTSAVLTDGLSIKMLPVRTNNPIPKNKMLDAMKEIKKIKVTKPIKINDVIVKDFLGLGVDLVATRSL